ncbi:hypothetical protein CHX26_09045 [Porphyrobacter sp. HT-58-2]|uniref:glycosyltransferase n=1 Tax=Porphyrobacter sp. HT-58-2 TaxID=2023229 RepID=UPI000CDCA3D2|nr:glycosyltransferase [Porphyrobacter sp. HT-58-2]AUX69621.1 hypothetical protein CHX26_09045 [Porphyrobacter sp. HT-58-2]
MPKISVTIATFNRQNLLQKVLDALSFQSVPANTFDVIVCDSESTDGTAEMMKNYKSLMPYRLEYHHTSNILAAKRNLGISKSTSDFVVFLDDDCIPSHNFVETHLDSCLRTMGERVIYCGEVRYPAEWINKSNYYRFRDSRHFGFKAGVKRLEYLDYRTIVVMNMCFERGLFLKHIGSVNESFIGYGAEDQDLGWRLQEAGYRLRPNSAKIIHFETTSSIRQYGEKIKRSSRDGMTTLLRVNRPAALGIMALKKLDAEFPNRSVLDRMTRILILIGLRFRLNRPLELLLEQTDGCPLLYSSKLYRILMGIYYVQGSIDRDNRLTVEESTAGWYR